MSVALCVFQPPIVARPEDGHNRWLKHVGGQVDYNIINLHPSICTCWLILVKNHQRVVVNHLKLRIYVFCHVTLLDEWFATFQRIILSLSAGSSNPRRLSYREDGDTRILHNIRKEVA